MFLRVKQTMKKRVIKLGDLNKLAGEDLIFSINTGSAVGKVAFGLVQGAKSLEFSMHNCKLTWM